MLHNAQSFTTSHFQVVSLQMHTHLLLGLHSKQTGKHIVLLH